MEYGCWNTVVEMTVAEADKLATESTYIAASPQ